MANKSISLDDIKKDKDLSEFVKEKGLAEFWEGKYDGAFFTYFPAITSAWDPRVEFVYEDGRFSDEEAAIAWRKKAFWRIHNSIEHGNKWKSDFHKRKSYNKTNGYNLRWGREKITIEQINENL